jgi:Translation initiation factor IF-2, N-terminal region
MLESGHNYKKRGCQLPYGCKDLNDVHKLEKIQKSAEGTKPIFCKTEESIPQTKSPLQGMTVEVKSTIVVKELAQFLSIKPFIVLAGLLALGVFANLNETLNFDTASKVFAKYGVVAKRSV